MLQSVAGNIPLPVQHRYAIALARKATTRLLPGRRQSRQKQSAAAEACRGNDCRRQESHCRSEEAEAQGACGGDGSDKQRPTGITEFAADFGRPQRFAESFGRRGSGEKSKP